MIRKKTLTLRGERDWRSGQVSTDRLSSRGTLVTSYAMSAPNAACVPSLLTAPALVVIGSLYVLPLCSPSAAPGRRRLPACCECGAGPCCRCPPQCRGWVGSVHGHGCAAVGVPGVLAGPATRARSTPAGGQRGGHVIVLVSLWVLGGIRDARARSRPLDCGRLRPTAAGLRLCVCGPRPPSLGTRTRTQSRGTHWV